MSEDKSMSFAEFHELNAQEKADYLEMPLKKFNKNMNNVIRDVENGQHIRFITQPYKSKKFDPLHIYDI